jgi:hypothetical protein
LDAVETFAAEELDLADLHAAVDDLSCHPGRRAILGSFGISRCFWAGTPFPAEFSRVASSESADVVTP